MEILGQAQTRTSCFRWWICILFFTLSEHILLMAVSRKRLLAGPERGTLPKLESWLYSLCYNIVMARSWLVSRNIWNPSGDATASGSPKWACSLSLSLLHAFSSCADRQMNDRGRHHVAALSPSRPCIFTHYHLIFPLLISQMESEMLNQLF